MAKQKEPEKEFRLVKDSIYRIRSLQEKDNPLVTEGVFDGMGSLANVVCIVMVVKEGGKEIKRLLPAHMIIAVDVLDQKEEKETSEKESTEKYFM